MPKFKYIWLNFIVHKMFMLLFYILRVFHIIVTWWSLIVVRVFHVSRTLLSIRADLNIAVVWMVSNLPLTSSSSSVSSMPLGTVPSALTIIGITVTLMFYSLLFNHLAKPNCLFIFSLSFIFPLRPARRAKSTRFYFFERGTYLFAEMQSVYSIATAAWAL